MDNFSTVSCRLKLKYIKYELIILWRINSRRTPIIKKSKNCKGQRQCWRRIARVIHDEPNELGSFAT